MKWFQFNASYNTRVNVMQLVAYVLDNDKYGWYIKLYHTGGVAVSGESHSSREAVIFLKYAEENDRDADVETLDAICIHEK